MNAEHTWQATLGELELQIPKATFNTWLKNTHVEAYEDGLFVIGVGNAYAVDWLENRLMGTIKRTLTNIAGRAVDLKFTLKTVQEPVPEQTNPSSQPLGPMFEHKDTSHKDAAPPQNHYPPPPPSYNGNGNGSRWAGNLNARYTFDTYIVGQNNRLAHAAAMAIAERPAEAYNPLYIYGGVGLGKTHLLHAVGNYLGHRRVRYVSSEEFTNDLISAIRQQTTNDFRQQYRSIDVLLIDDIQFIGGKERTQEEFFHTFNALQAANKQIVLSSDCPPKAIPTLEARLRSRFEGGLIADIQPPGLETRIAILEFHTERQPISVPREVISFIAAKVQTNVRELVGALNRVLVFCQTMNQPLNPDVAEQALTDLVEQRELTPEYIIDAVANFYDLDATTLSSKSRKKAISTPRQIAIYFLREETDVSLPQIGEMLGGRDHTTILYGYEKIKELRNSDAQFRRELTNIRNHLHNN